VKVHVGSRAFLSVPAMHAAERRILNSWPSFETRVTNFVGSDIIAEDLADQRGGEGVVRR
jgi:hypothetical protein